MKCYYPIHRKTRLGTGMDVKVRCGQCIACRVQQREEKACRLAMESINPAYRTKDGHAIMWITLTYSNENLPEGNNVSKKEMQDWLKRVRVYLRRKTNHTGVFKYAVVGEYGGRFGRPHYHAVLFGVSDVYPDPVCDPRQYFKQLRSKLIEETWDKGIYSCEPWSIDRSNYLAGYVTKKIVKSDEDPMQGEEPEFYLASRKPPIGSWMIKEIAQNMRKYVPEEMLDRWESERWVPTLIRLQGKNRPLDKWFQDKLRKELQYPDDSLRLWNTIRRQKEDPSWGWESEILKERQLSRGKAEFTHRHKNHNSQF